jgi:hypothetical protein
MHSQALLKYPSHFNPGPWLDHRCIQTAILPHFHTLINRITGQTSQKNDEILLHPGLRGGLFGGTVQDNCGVRLILPFCSPEGHGRQPALMLGLALRKSSAVNN